MDAPLKVIRSWFDSLDEYTRNGVASSCVFYLSSTEESSESRTLFFELLNAEMEYHKEVGKALSIIALIDYVLDEMADPIHWENTLNTHLDILDSDAAKDVKTTLNTNLPTLPEKTEGFRKAGASWKRLRETSLDTVVIRVWEEERQVEHLSD
jgi:hypothetical protein